MPSAQETRVVGAHRHVRTKRNAQARTGGCAVHGREDGLLDPDNHVEDLVPPHGQFAKMRRDACLAVADIWDFFQIEARAERIPGPREQNRADGVIGFGMKQRIQRFLDTSQVQCVSVLRQIENNLRNAVFDDIDDAAVIGVFQCQFLLHLIVSGEAMGEQGIHPV